MKKKWEYVLNTKQVYSLALLFLAILFISCLEILGLASITAFVSILINNDNNFLLSYLNLEEYFYSLTTEKRVLYGAFFLFFLFLFKSLIQVLYNLFEVVITRDITLNNSYNYFNSTLYSPYKKHIERNSSFLIRKIQIDIAAVTAYFYNIITILKESVILLAIFTLLFLNDPLISTSTFILLGLFSFIFYLLIKKKLTFLTKKTQLNKARMIEIITHSVSSFKENLILRIRRNISENYFKELKSIEDYNLFSNFILKIPRIFLEFLAISGILFVTFLFIYFEKSTLEIIPLLTLLVTSLLRMIPSFNGITSSVGNLRINRVKFKEITDDFSNQEKYLENFISENKNDSELIDFKNDIQLKNISFKYENTDRKIIDKISFQIKKGQSIGIIGQTGSGKSTLVDLILGVLEPNEGEILIDGSNLNYKNLSSWHRNIGYIPQDLFLINDTIKKNIALGISDEKIDVEKLDRAVKISNLGNFISKLEKKLDTKVGERGIKISGGEKQRVSIARAFYNKPNIIVMDEATSSLDNNTEKEFMKSIETIKNNSTLIIIAHRLTTVKNCDIIYLVADGKIKDYGNYNEIIIRNKL